MRFLRIHPRTAALLFLLVLAAPPAEGTANYGGPLRLGIRHGDFDDPGVVQIRGLRATDIRKVRFGGIESPAIATGEAPGITAAIPPGKALTRVAVRVLLEDGRELRIGSFRYDDPLFARRNRHVSWDHWAGCSAGEAPDVRQAGVLTSSRVDRLKDGGFSYTYRAASTYLDDVTVLWDPLQYLGLPEGLSVTLAPGGVFETTRLDWGRPVLVLGRSSIDRRPGCAPGDEGGTEWDDGAYVPASSLPFSGPMRNLRVFPLSDNGNLLTWEDPESGPPDRVEITFRYVRGYDGQTLGNHETRRYTTPPGALEARMGSVSAGVESAAVRPVRDGIVGEASLAYTVR